MPTMGAGWPCSSQVLWQVRHADPEGQTGQEKKGLITGKPHPEGLGSAPKEGLTGPSLEGTPGWVPWKASWQPQ